MVECWGNNSHGQLGNGSIQNALAPVEAVITGRAVSIAAGLGHSCAVLSDGSVICWGWNFTGELGNGISSDTNSPSPVSTSITGGALAVAVSGGLNEEGHSCALLSGGAVTCWGDDSYQELGGVPADAGAGVSAANILGCDPSDRRPRVFLRLGERWHSVVLGAVGDRTILPDRHARSRTEQRGVNYIAASQNDFTVPYNGSACLLSRGSAHACALLADGSVKCWGGNSYGQLGNGRTTDSSTAVQVQELPVAIAIGVGVGHSCAVVWGGTVVCWGDNSGGRLETDRRRA